MSTCGALARPAGSRGLPPASVTVGGDLAGLTGEDRLAGKVRDFADNWDYNRGKLVEKLQFLRDGLDAIVDSMTEVDAELARQAQEAAPETQNDEEGEG